MGEWLGRGRRARRAYGFDEIALVPGNITINPEEVDSSWTIAGQKYAVPIIASAMDGVVDVAFAVKMSKLGALAALNLEGVQTRYDDPNEVKDAIDESQSERAAETKLIMLFRKGNASARRGLMERFTPVLDKFIGINRTSETHRKRYCV